jgi:hypothetical protein
VDPALAVRARADLPWRPWEAHPPIEVVPIEWPSAVVAAPHHRRITPGVGIAAAVGIAVVALSVLPTRDRPTLAAVAESVKPPPRVTPSTPSPQPPPAQVKPARTTRVARPKSTQTTQTTTASTPAPKPKPKAPKPRPKATPQPQPKPLPTPPPKRTYAWKPYVGAVYYQVSFRRNGGAFYETQTRTARVRLPDGLRFAPGRYSWTVRPAIVADLGIRLGDEIVRRAFLVRGD